MTYRATALFVASVLLGVLALPAAAQQAATTILAPTKVISLQPEVTVLPGINGPQQDETLLNYYVLGGGSVIDVSGPDVGDIRAAAILFTAPFTGTINRIEFPIYNGPLTGGTNATGVAGTGNFKITLVPAADLMDEEAEGIASVAVDLSQLTPASTLTFANAIDLNFDVEEGEDYFLLFTLEGESNDAAVTMVFDGGSTNTNDTDYYPEGPGSARSFAYVIVGPDMLVPSEGFYSFTNNPNLYLDIFLTEGTTGGECAGIAVGDARNAPATTNVTVEGVVTRAMGRIIRVQDATGGISVFQSSGAFFDAVADGTISEGDQVCISGARSDFSGLQQITPESFVVTQGGVDLPAVQMVTIPEILAAGESLESELIEVAGLLIVNTTDTQFQANTTYTARDPQGSEIAFRVQAASDNALVGQPIPQERFRFTGVLGENNGTYQLIPVNTTDLNSDPQTATEDPSVPGVFTLHAAYPNPFNPQATLSFELEQAARATLTVYDGLGRQIAVLLAKDLPAGTHGVAFDASALPSGTYFYRLDAGGHARTRALTLMK